MGGRIGVVVLDVGRRGELAGGDQLVVERLGFVRPHGRVAGAGEDVDLAVGEVRYRIDLVAAPAVHVGNHPGDAGVAVVHAGGIVLALCAIVGAAGEDAEAAGEYR